MGLFDLFKKRVTKENSILPKGNTVSLHPNAQTVYFKNGKMYKVYPTDLESWYDARYLVSDGVLYDLESIPDIQSIPVPNFNRHDSSMEGYGIKGRLDYVLRMKAGNLYNRLEKELCSACLWKSAELMLATDDWQRKDFERLVTWHYAMGMVDEAKRAEQYINSHTQSMEDSFNKYALQHKNDTFSHFKGDLIAFNDYGTGCCEKCSIFGGRVYSISGKNKIFPKLPEYAKEHGNFHKGCRCVMASYLDIADRSIFYKGIRQDAVTVSNRPWIDNRTANEIERYNAYLDHISQAERERQYMLEVSKRQGQNRLEYESIKRAFPEKAPKSVTGYARMKTMRTKNFIALADMAKSKGIEIVYFDAEGEN